MISMVTCLAFEYGTGRRYDTRWTSNCMPRFLSTNRPSAQFFINHEASWVSTQFVDPITCALVSLHTNNNRFISAYPCVHISSCTEGGFEDAAPQSTDPSAWPAGVDLSERI
jgi:hypothetical protein